MAGNYQVNLNTLALQHTLVCTKCETDTLFCAFCMSVTEMEIVQGEGGPSEWYVLCQMPARVCSTAISLSPQPHTSQGQDLERPAVNGEGLLHGGEKLSFGPKQENSGLSVQTDASSWVCRVFIFFFSSNSEF